MVINLWLVGVTFNPKLIDNVETHDNVIVKIVFNKVVQKVNT
jgi:hypothetical protein